MFDASRKKTTICIILLNMFLCWWSEPTSIHSSVQASMYRKNSKLRWFCTFYGKNLLHVNNMHYTVYRSTALWHFIKLPIPLFFIAVSVLLSNVHTYVLYFKIKSIVPKLLKPIRSEIRRKKTTIIFSLQNMIRKLLYPSSVAIILNC